MPAEVTSATFVTGPSRAHAGARPPPLPCTSVQQPLPMPGQCDPRGGGASDRAAAVAPPARPVQIAGRITHRGLTTDSRMLMRLASSRIVSG